jgi:hypothetical protein
MLDFWSEGVGQVLWCLLYVLWRNDISLFEDLLLNRAGRRARALIPHVTGSMAVQFM